MMRRLLMTALMNLAAPPSFKLSRRLPRCLLCATPLRPGVAAEPGEEYRVAEESPAGGVVFDGGWNFGSRLYDATVPDGRGARVSVRLVVCDDCLSDAVRRGLAREVSDDSPDRSEAESGGILLEIDGASRPIGEIASGALKVARRLGPGFRPKFHCGDAPSGRHILLQVRS